MPRFLFDFSSAANCALYLPPAPVWALKAAVCLLTSVATRTELSINFLPIETPTSRLLKVSLRPIKDLTANLKAFYDY